VQNLILCFLLFRLYYTATRWAAFQKGCTKMLDNTVIITGGNTGLGYECAKSIVASGQGWCVIIAGRSKQKISEAAKRFKYLVAPARIVVVSSDTHDPAQKTGMPAPYYENAALLALPEGNTALPQTEDPAIGRWRYTTLKLCNIYFTYELSRRLEKQGLSTNQKPVTANAFNPGLMPGTGLARDYRAVLDRLSLLDGAN
jgi:NAD(P)-dependent dehydrogenase (short-subunit alcohol dehydrogenase family)